MREIGIEGNADLASTVQHLFRHLRWDIAEDLSRIFGDVLAQRMVTESRHFAAWNREAAEKLAQNFAEYWTEEQPLLARPAEVRQFLADADQLRDDLARLEKRIETLAERHKFELRASLGVLAVIEVLKRGRCPFSPSRGLPSGRKSPSQGYRKRFPGRASR